MPSNTSGNAERRKEDNKVIQTTACSHFCAQEIAAWESTQSVSGGATFHKWLRLWIGPPIRPNFFYLWFTDTLSCSYKDLDCSNISFIPTEHTSHRYAHTKSGQSCQIWLAYCTKIFFICTAFFVTYVLHALCVLTICNGQHGGLVVSIFVSHLHCWGLIT